jgi:general secretion pathway protein K
VKHLHGAEDDDYRSAGMRWGVRDGPFASVEEYRYVMGMSNQLFDRLAPYLTVHSGHNSVEPAYAPAWLASVLAAPELNAARRTARGRADTGTRGGVYRISVWATGKGGSAASLDMVVRTTPTGRQPYTILSWRAPARLIGASFG